MEQKIKNLEKQIFIGKILFVFLLLLDAVITINFFKKKNDVNEIIRVKGIIVVDEHNKERILIGAPVPYAKNRARTDTNVIKQKWAVGMPSGYMDNYKSYNHNCNGIVFLDENGWDRIAIGNPVPDPIIGKRIGPSTGMIYNDEKGLERSGYGLLKVDDKIRVVLGLDHDNGTEGAAISVLPDGSTGIYFDTKQNSIFMGHATPLHWKSPNKRNFTGIILEDSSGRKKVVTTH